VVVENNHLSVDQNHSRSEELVNCQGDSSCRTTVRDKYRQEYDKVQARITSCTGAEQCVAVAKELRALQSDYSARMSEIQEKARMQGLDSLTPAEVREWADLRGAMSNIDASRNLVLHRAQVTGGSEETTQEIVKIMGQTGIAASAGVAGGISKAGAKVINSDQSQQANADKGSKSEVAGKTNYPEGINFKIEQPKHLATLDGYSQKKGISGAHNADVFYKAASDNGVKIVSQTPGTVNGITHIKYQVPTKDRAGNFDGGYKKEILEKTVYDPKVFSDKRILELGQKAAANGYHDAIASGKREYMATADGVKFQVYLDQKTGTVTNFFPVTK
uniref:CdiA family toxin C-terminal domain-containing protein n=1 Tax=Photorhabdus sp. CRCIA-P01 TaxID=2019570 RepID=UPI001E292E1F